MDRLTAFQIIIVIAAVVSLLAFSSLTYTTALTLHKQCSGAPRGCTVLGHVPLEGFVGIGAGILTIIGTIYIFIRSQQNKILREHEQETLQNAVKALPAEEEAIYEILQQAGGSDMQSNVMRKTGYSKVKTSRLLDRLEAKGLLERKRAGMGNLVVLKH